MILKVEIDVLHPDMPAYEDSPGIAVIYCPHEWLTPDAPERAFLHEFITAMKHGPLPLVAHDNQNDGIITMSYQDDDGAFVDKPLKI